MSAENVRLCPDAGGIRALLVRQVMELPVGFPDDGDLFEAGLDSMAIMQLLLHLEEEFGVRVAMAEVTRENFATAAAIARLVAVKTSGHDEEDCGSR